MKAVLISDIHFTVATLELATQALVQAMTAAYNLDVPLIICGDTLDGKAIIRGEVANRLIALLKEGPLRPVRVIVLVGNHDLLSEKAYEHALEFLKPYCEVIDQFTYDGQLKLYLMPYCHNPEKLLGRLNTIPEGATIIMHQGVQTAHMGHYAQDKTSLPKEAFANFRVISGHYHQTQDIVCGKLKGTVGLFSYVGNPYTLTFGEANDGPKGFACLLPDGNLLHHVLELRKHVIIERDFIDWDDELTNVYPGDLVWLKIKGTQSQLSKLKKQAVGLKLFGHNNFKLDKILTDQSDETLTVEQRSMKDEDVLDVLINKTAESPTQKTYLKKLWREVINK